jgi:hypothetical protein
LESTRTPVPGGSVIAARERHDLLGAHRHGRPAAHPADEIAAFTGADADKSRSPLVELEVDLAAVTLPLRATAFVGAHPAGEDAAVEHLRAGGVVIDDARPGSPHG